MSSSFQSPPQSFLFEAPKQQRHDGGTRGPRSGTPNSPTMGKAASSFKTGITTAAIASHMCKACNEDYDPSMPFPRELKYGSQSEFKGADTCGCHLGGLEVGLSVYLI